jgi:predicted metalloprotease
MRWRGRRASAHVEDRRGRGGPRGRGGRPLGLGLGGLLVVGLLAMLFGVAPPALFEALEQTQVSTQAGSVPPAATGPVADELGRFAAVVLADTEQAWQGIFAAAGARYREPTLVLFSGSVRSACGFGSAASGPFYCPADDRVYLDLSFFDQLERRFGAPGDFAQAYVIGHEVGHHVQNLLGTAEQVRSAQARGGETAANRLQVAMELQADCFAGVWAQHANRRDRVLEPGDVEEGLAAAAAIGDDRLQRNAGRSVAPDSFTHGSSAARQRWLGAGLDHGDPAACDTFK